VGAVERRGARPAAVLLPAVCALVFASACASTPRGPWVLSSDQLRASPARQMEQIGSYPEAVATAIYVMEREVGLPRPQASFVFVPDDAAFEAQLLEIGYPEDLARSASQLMTAIGGHRAVLVNERRLSRQPWPGRMITLAHELTHVLQYELGGGTRGTSAQWLREGFAEWVAMRVLAALGQLDPGTVRREAIMRVRTAAPADGFARLRSLSTFPAWVDQSRGPGGSRLYDFALIGAMTLVERHGLDKLLGYFRRFATRQDPAANFLEAFGESETTFEATFRSIVWGGRAR
jgi:hypothetical protein